MAPKNVLPEPCSRPAAGGPRPSWRLTAAPVLSYVDRFGFLPLVAVSAHGLGSRPQVIGAAVSLYFLLYGAAQPVIGALSDRYGRVAVLRSALLLLAVADIVGGFATSPTMLIAARGVAGGASGALLPTTLVYLGDTVQFRFRQRTIAQVLAAASLAAGLAMIVSGLLGEYASWRAWLFLVAIAAPVAGMKLRGLAEPADRRGGGRHWAALLRDPVVLGLLGYALVEGAAMLGFFTFFPSVLEAHGASSAIAGTVVSTYGIAALGGARLLARLPQKLVPQVPLGAGGGALVAGYALVAANQSVPAVLTASLLMGASFSLFHSTFQTWATQLRSEARGLVTSLFVSCVFTGAGLGTLLASPFVARHAYGLVFSAAAVLAATVSTVGAAARLRYKDNRSQPGAPDLRSPEGSSDGFRVAASAGHKPTRRPMTDGAGRWSEIASPERAGEPPGQRTSG
jgi:predicted MFS family arabinose efflux permease